MANRDWKLIIRLLICVVMYSSLPVRGQEPVFRATTRLVEVSVVATDGKGVAIQDLKKEDFTILEDGKPQQVSHFFTEAILRAGAAPPKLPKGIYTNRPELLPHSPRTVNAIVIDYLNTPWVAQTATREQLLGALRKLRENDVVAIYTLGQTLSILHDYTSDRKSLEAKLKKSEGLLTLRSKSENDMVSLGGARWNTVFGESQSDLENVYVATMQRTRSILTIRTLSLVARHMAGIPGRKNLIWMSSGFPIEIATNEGSAPTVRMSGGGGIVNNMGGMRKPSGEFEGTLLLDMLDKSIRQINASGVSVYGIDVNGLVVPIAPMAGYSMEVTNRALARIANEREAQTGLTEFSSRTGGVAALNSNDISGAITRALDDARYSYSLAYPTTNGKADGKYRKIEVKVNRPGVKLRYRNGYNADDPGKEPAGIAKGDLDEASQSPVMQTGVLLTTQVQMTPQNEISIVLQIEPTQLSLRQTKDGWTGALDLMFIQRGRDGKMNGLKASMPLRLSEENFQTVMKKGLLYRRTMPREPGSVAMRVVVRDANNGATGTLDVPLAQ